MKGFIFASLALGATTAFASILPRAGSLPAVTIKGNAFFAGSHRFYIRGVDYQAGGSSKLADPIADNAEETCTRDIKEFQKLGINTIRVYTIDNSLGHDKCMTALANAGIYLILDVNSPQYSINQYDPYPSYNDVYLQSVFATIEAFAKYTNTLAFFSGNEVINDNVTSTLSAPYVKAVTRDMKQFIRERKLRPVPVGYSGADVSENRYTTALYMNCGPDGERGDFFAFNDYAYCGSSYKVSGWDQKVALFSNYTIPIFLSEYGCNKNKRTFTEVADLYGSQMTPVYSGGLVYEYTQEVSNYGLVDLSSGKLQELPDFATLQAAYKKTPNPTGDGGYRADAGGAMTCPGSNEFWIPANDSLPIIPAKAVQYMTAGAGKAPGLSNKAGSQNAGTPSTGFAINGTSTTGSSGGATTSTGSAAALRIPEVSFAPFACAGVFALSALFGASLL